MDIINPNNSHVLEVEGLQDADGNFVPGADVRVTLYENDGVTPVGGVTWPISCEYEGKLGMYSAEIPATAEVVDRGRYKMKVTAESAGKRYEVERIVYARDRYR